MKPNLQLITGAAILTMALSGYGNDRDDNVGFGSKSDSRRKTNAWGGIPP